MALGDARAGALDWLAFATGPSSLVIYGVPETWVSLAAEVVTGLDVAGVSEATCSVTVDGTTATVSLSGVQVTALGDGVRWWQLTSNGVPVLAGRWMAVPFPTAAWQMSTVVVSGGVHITVSGASGGAGGGGGVSDHGGLTGLGDDDHAHYLTAARHDARDHSVALGTASLSDLADVAATAPSDGQVLVFGAGSWGPGMSGGGVSDHGALTGLADDDHAQYLTTARHLAIAGNPHGTSAAQVGADPAGTAATAVAAEAAIRLAADVALDGRLDVIEAVSIATDAELAAAITAHEAAANPHPTYTTDAEATTIAQDAAMAVITAHGSALDPHPGYLTSAEGAAAFDALGTASTLVAAEAVVRAAADTALDGRLDTLEAVSIATDAELAAAVAAHEADTTSVHGITDTSALVTTSTAPELIRDTMATALVAGTNVTITPNDGADTITIAASGGGGSYVAPLPIPPPGAAAYMMITDIAGTSVAQPIEATHAYSPYVPRRIPRALNLTSVGFVTNNAAAGVTGRPIVWLADETGKATTLLFAPSATDISAATTLYTYTLGSPVALAAGSQIWVYLDVSATRSVQCSTLGPMMAGGSLPGLYGGASVHVEVSGSLVVADNPWTSKTVIVNSRYVPRFILGIS